MAVKTDARLRMIGAAMDLFHERGVNATSIDDVLARSKTGKSQFTHYFRNKDGLIHAVLQNLYDVITNGRAPTGYHIKNWDDMEAWFGKYIAFQKRVECTRSCPLGTIGNDVTDDQQLLRQDIRMFLQWCHDQLARFFAAEKAAGRMVAAADPDGLADLCVIVMQGGMLVSKVKRDTDMFERAAAQAIAYLRSQRKAAH